MTASVAGGSSARSAIRPYRGMYPRTGQPDAFVPSRRYFSASIFARMSASGTAPTSVFAMVPSALTYTNVGT